MFGGAIIGCAWFIFAVSWKKIFGRATTLAPKIETPDGQPAEVGLGVHISFGPMLGMAALCYYFGADRWVDLYFATLSEIF
jgi:leader peptidase (prepilin peptidase)/N-methyltransferase